MTLEFQLSSEFFFLPFNYVVLSNSLQAQNLNLQVHATKDSCSILESDRLINHTVPGHILVGAKSLSKATGYITLRLFF